MNVMWLGISTIRDGGAQMRVQMNEEHIERLVEALQSGAELPPIVVFHDTGEAAYWLADGYHRYEAHKRVGRNVIQAEVHPGDRRDALLYATGANAAHGLPRTRADVRRAIAVLLHDEEWRQWSDREIARRVGCSHPTVAAVRRDLEASGKIDQMSERQAARNGATYTVAVAARADDERAIEAATAALRRAQDVGPETQARREALAQAERAIARIRDEQERQGLAARLALLQSETEQARGARVDRGAALLAEAEAALARRDWSACVEHMDQVADLLDDSMPGLAERRRSLLADIQRAAGARTWYDVRDLAYLQRAAALLDQAQQCADDAARGDLLSRARLELACVRDQASEAWRDLDRRQLALRFNPPQARRADETPAAIRFPSAPGERPEVRDIRHRAALLGYRCTLTGLPGEDRILIWRPGERLSDLDSLTFDDARAWLDEREAELQAWIDEREAEEGGDLAAYQERVGALLVAADIRLLRLLGVIFGLGDETDVEIIAQEMVSVALQSDPDRLYRILAQVKGELELRYHP